MASKMYEITYTDPKVKKPVTAEVMISNANEDWDIDDAKTHFQDERRRAGQIITVTAIKEIGNVSPEQLAAVVADVNDGRVPVKPEVA